MNLAAQTGNNRSNWGKNKRQKKVARFDVAVYGATPGGIAAAIATARMGQNVVLIEPTDHIGGIVSNGLTRSDIDRRQAVGGLFYEFTRCVLAYYQALDKVRGSGSVNADLSRNGYWFEASVAEKIFHEMLAAEGGKITIYYQCELKRAIKHGNRLTSLVAKDLARGEDEIIFDAQVFVDATYEGDLAALAGAPFRVGREARAEYGEPHAGKVYTHVGQLTLLPGSTGEPDRAIQAYCFRFHMTKNPSNRIAVTRPTSYSREDYRFLLEDFRTGKLTNLKQVIQVNQMPNGKVEINSNNPDETTGVPSESLDLAEENWSWPEATPSQRRRIYERYLSYDVGLIWMLQNDPDVPASIREEAQSLGWCRDEWVGNNHLPRQLYVREARRIIGEYVLTERDGELDAQTGRTTIQSASIGIAEYNFDIHGTHKYDQRFPGVRGGYVVFQHQPFQIPYGVLIPRQVDNLLVPVACSASHVSYSAIRMEPVYMSLGQASGIAASIAVTHRISAQKVPVALLQRELAERGGVITYLQDIPFNHKSFAAFQFLGTRGLNVGYRAQPDKLLTRKEGWDSFERVVQAEGKSWTPPKDRRDKPLTRRDFIAWLKEAGWLVPPDVIDDDDKAMRVEDFAVLLYQAYPFDNVVPRGSVSVRRSALTH
jgi:hypothetical protein